MDSTLCFPGAGGGCGSLRPTLRLLFAVVEVVLSAVDEGVEVEAVVVVATGDGRTGERQLMEPLGGVGAARGEMLTLLPRGEIGPAAVSSADVTGAGFGLTLESGSAKEVGGGTEGLSGISVV